MSKPVPSLKQPEDAAPRKVRPAPLRLKELFFPRIHVTALVPKGDPVSSLSPNLEDASLDFRFEFSKDGTEASAGMRIRSKETAGEGDSNIAYTVDVEAFAVFFVESPENDRPIAVYLRKFAAAAALLGAIREQIAICSARGPWGVFHIPIVSMDLIVGPPPSTAKESPPAKKASKRVVSKTIAS